MARFKVDVNAISKLQPRSFSNFASSIASWILFSDGGGGSALTVKRSVSFHVDSPCRIRTRVCFTFETGVSNAFIVLIEIVKRHQ